MRSLALAVTALTALAAPIGSGAPGTSTSSTASGPSAAPVAPVRSAAPAAAIPPSAAPRRAAGQDEYDPDSRAHDLFEVVLPELRAVRAGGEPLSAARLEWLYDRLLVFRAEHPGRWPEGEPFLEVADAVHAYAAEGGHDLGPLAWSDWNRSLVFEARGAFGEVRALLEQNLARYPPSEPHRPLLLYTLAHYERLCGRWEEALERLDGAAAAVDLTPESYLASLARAAIDLERCAVSIELGLFEDAIPAAARARERAEELGDPLLWTDTVVEDLNLAVALDDFARLRSVLERARAHPWHAELSARDRARLRLRLAIGTAEDERARGRPPREARALLEELVAGGELLERDARLARVWLADLLIEAGALAEAEAQLAALDSAAGGDAAEAAAWCGDGLPDRLEVARVVLAGRLALARGDPPVALREQLVRMEDAFEALLARAGATRVREQGLAVLQARLRMQMTDGLVALTLRVHPDDGPARALERVARAQALGSLARTLGAEPAREADVRAALVPAGGGLLVYLPGAARSLAFAVDAAGARVFEAAPVYRLDPLRRELARAVGQAVQPGAGAPERARVEELADELGDALLPPALLRHVAPWRDLVVVGVEHLGYVPFELLPAGDGARLGVAKDVSYLPSLPVGLWLARRRAATRDGGARERVTVVAAPDATGSTDVAEVADATGATGATEEVGARRGVEGLASLRAVAFGADEERLLLGDAPRARRVIAGPAATLERLRALDASGDLALQLVAHGVRGARADRPPALLLASADGGGARTLTPDVAEALDVPPLVVVTACGAWRGPQRRGDDGRAHLAGALLVAGARTLIVSHAPVDYRSSLRTMGVFWEEILRRGRSPAAALARARAEAEPGDLTPFLVHAVGLATEPVAAPAPVEAARAGGGRGGPEASSPLGTAGSAWLAAGALALLAAGFLLRRASNRA